MLTNADFEVALKKSHTSKLSSQRKAMIPNVHWSDIGGLAEAKKEILNTIQLPLLHPEVFGDLARYHFVDYEIEQSNRFFFIFKLELEFFSTVVLDLVCVRIDSCIY